MIGQLSVGPNTPFASSVIAVVLVAVGALGYGWWRIGNRDAGN
jgi:hypothetical protein